MEGFDYMTSITSPRFNSPSGGTIVTGRNSGSAGQFLGSGSGATLAFAGIPQGDRIIFGFAFKVPSGTMGVDFARINDTGGTTHLIYSISATGIISVTRNSVSLTGATGTTNLTTGIWYYLEFEQIISDTVGEIHCYLDGIQEFSTASNLDTQNGGTGIINAFTPTSNNNRTIQVDDIYIRSATAGETQKTSFLGDVRVSGLLPTGAGNSAQFTPSAGSNYQNVDDTAADGDSTYNESSTLNHIDSFVFADLPSTGTVYAVQSQVMARKTDAGTRSVASVYRISSTNYVGIDNTLSVDYNYEIDLKELSPATAAAWTVSEINSAEFGYKLTV